MNDLHKRNSRRLRKTAAIAATTLILTMPVNNVMNQFNIPGFEAHYASAATLAEVNLLQSTNVTATANGENDFALEVSGQSLANLELLGPDRVAVRSEEHTSELKSR